MIGASTGIYGAVWSQAELRKTLAAAGARVVEAEVTVAHADTRFDEQGELNAPNIAEQIREVVATLTAEADPARVKVAA